ncbi:hypothetical protein Tco_0780599, partial [Tanacetum coccineum]
DQPMWAADRVVAPTPGSAITLPATANEFAIKALFDRLLGEIRAFSQHENETLTDAWLRMKEMLRNCHGHNLSKGNIIKIFYQGLTEATQEALNFAADGPSNNHTDKIMARMDAMAIKMEAQYEKFLDVVCAVRMNVPLVDVLAGMPNYNKFLKELISNKNKIEQIFAAFLSDESSAMIQNKVPPKLGDPGSFSLFHATSTKLSLAMLWPTLVLALISCRIPYSAIKHSYSNDDTCFSIDVIDDILEEDFDALLDEGSQILHSIDGTILDEKLFTEFDEFITMTADENHVSENPYGEEPRFEKNSPSHNYKINIVDRL